MPLGDRTLSVGAPQPHGPPPTLIAFEVEVRTATGEHARYTALATSSCGALLAALEVWGFAKISVAPRRHRC